MRWLRAWFLRLGGLFHRERRDRELAEELESHIQLHMEDNLRAGMTPEEARRDALISLGGVESVKEAYRDQRGVPWLETMIRDLRYGARMLWKNPGFHRRGRAHARARHWGKHGDLQCRQSAVVQSRTGGGAGSARLDSPL